jgi:hypothetical protein
MQFFRARKPSSPLYKVRPMFLFPRSMYLILAAIFLIMLSVLGWLAAWLGIPAWYIRLAGTQTTGTAKVVASCGADDYATQGDNAETFQYAFQITDARGHAHLLTTHSACNNLYANGERVTIWYLPNNLTSFLTSAEALWLYILTPIWLIIAGIVAYFFWWLARPFALLAFGRLKVPA